MAIAHLVSPPAAGYGSTVIRRLRRQLTLLPLVTVFYFTVSGGAYGLEPLVSASGPGMALLLIVVTPVIWGIPAALMVAELSTAIPVAGGYYAWVKKGLGPYWGFLEGWWSWIDSFVDLAIYPVLFATYLSALAKQYLGTGVIADDPWVHWGVTLAVIWGFALLNVRGARTVGTASLLFFVLTLAPFVALVVVGVARLAGDPARVAQAWQPLAAPGSGVLGAFGAGLFIVMWNYQGWDAVSTVDGEIVRPRRTVPLALLVSVPLVVLTYLLPVAAGLASSLDWAKWREGSFPVVATALGGEWLGTWLAIGGLVSAVGLYSANLLSVSRLPFVMAADGYLPQGIARLHHRYATPWVSILVCAAVFSVFTLTPFLQLVVVDVVLYAAALFLEFAALIVLRVREPGLPRPYRVPGGLPGVLLLALLPVAIVIAAVVNTFQTEGVEALYLSLAALATGPVAYPVCRLLFRRGRAGLDVDAEIAAVAYGELA